MTTLTPTAAVSARRAPLLPLLTQLVLAELRRLARNPMFALATLGFPILFFALFGLPAVHEKTAAGVNVGQYILVSFGTYSLLTLAMFSFGAAVASERTGGWLRLLRASPLPAPLYLLAKVIAALLFSALSLALLYAFAHFVGGVTLPAGQALLIAGKLLLGMVSLIALGLCIGFLANPTSASVIAQIISVLVSFGSGLFVPLDQLPKFVQNLAPYLPSYHLAQIGWNTLAGQGNDAPHWVWLAGYTLVFALVAAWAYRRDEARGE
ncbi:ABC transporter permease [Deinococcus metallilatus]|uniref:Transport permease protein n=1 Tax=Deinococcus metallilatus TaxID=1211322 RepID=A0AAJ5F259_9DEIO|nr:ABC transporter permease [Deinococcus metallilatus]MBB5296293.1 ABC-2 type transport system permease protein [Deinococcus metallilatus]QBY10023.1 ABC transporter permease [Deinococcus metallilatus]RXJ08747.1 ABC transporter permease [Deinococcus metallilatus]TLK25221.1 ABC transporter permease [Deinococcus metallilatus]GMA14795.1 ABC transporter [Deinococcus metallilatus]